MICVAFAFIGIIINLLDIYFIKTNKLMLYFAKMVRNSTKPAFILNLFQFLYNSEKIFEIFFNF